MHNNASALGQKDQSMPVTNDDPILECSMANARAEAYTSAPAAVAYTHAPNATAYTCIQGIAGPPGAGMFQTTVGPVATNTTHIIDSTLLTMGQAVRWYLSVIDVTANLCRTSDVSAVLSINGPSHVHYALNGDRILYGVHVTYTNGIMNLAIENLHTNSLSVSLVRLLITE